MVLGLGWPEVAESGVAAEKTVAFPFDNREDRYHTRHLGLRLWVPLSVSEERL